MHSGLTKQLMTSASWLVQLVRIACSSLCVGLCVGQVLALQASSLTYSTASLSVRCKRLPVDTLPPGLSVLKLAVANVILAAALLVIAPKPAIDMLCLLGPSFCHSSHTTDAFVLLNALFY